MTNLFVEMLNLFVGIILFIAQNTQLTVHNESQNDLRFSLFTYCTVVLLEKIMPPHRMYFPHDLSNVFVEYHDYLENMS